MRPLICSPKFLHIETHGRSIDAMVKDGTKLTIVTLDTIDGRSSVENF